MTLAIMAAFADDRKDAAERDQVKRIADSLSRDSELNVAAVYQDVLLKRASLETAVAPLTSPEAKRLAYELCVGVCDAESALAEAERAFLPPCRRVSGSTTPAPQPRAITARPTRSR